MPAEITLNDLLAEYDRLGLTAPTGSPGLTTREWAERWGVGERLTRQLIRKALDAGCAAIGRKPVRGMDGIMQRRACYTITLPKRKKGGR
jgi:hypothetical protein